VKRQERKAVFLDRDGVINRSVIRGGKPYSPLSLEEVQILPGVSDALKKLRAVGFLLICVTNQPDVARGKQSKEVVETIHEMLFDSLPLDEILVCYHDDCDGCPCRKPAPGLLLSAADRYAIDLERSFMVGDRWRDIEAGWNAGCKTVFIEYGYEEKSPSNPPDIKIVSLAEAVDWILNQI